MDRRLSGALAWGALLLIVGIPGFDMLNRRVDDTAGVATVPASDSTASAWKSGSDKTASDAASFGPLPQSATPDVADATAAGEDDSLPDVTLLASAPEATSETPPAAPTPSIISLDSSDAPAEPARIETLDTDAVISEVPTSVDITASPDVTASPEVTTSPEVTASADDLEPATEPVATENPDTVSSAIAARVRDVLFSSPDEPVVPDETTPPLASADIGLRSTISPPSGNGQGAAIDDDLAAVATAPLDFSTSQPVPPEIIPYPAPALTRKGPPVAQTAFVPPEPVPEIRPDNAIFFSDWVNTPPKTTATGPGR